MKLTLIVKHNFDSFKKTCICGLYKLQRIIPEKYHYLRSKYNISKKRMYGVKKIRNKRNRNCAESIKNRSPAHNIFLTHYPPQYYRYFTLILHFAFFCRLLFRFHHSKSINNQLIYFCYFRTTRLPQLPERQIHHTREVIRIRACITHFVLLFNTSNCIKCFFWISHCPHSAE